MEKIKPLETDLSFVSELDDEPNDIGGLSSEELKKIFDKAGNVLKKYINEVVVEAINTMKADEVGFARSDAVPADTVQDAVDNVRDQLKEVTLGQIPDNSIGTEKLTEEVRDMLDAVNARARIVVGTYVGTGTYGKDNPCTLEFDFKPLFVMVYKDSLSASYILAPYGATSASRDGPVGSETSGDIGDHYAWGDTTFSWYSYINSEDQDGRVQFNAEGTTYHYLAFLQEVAG